MISIALGFASVIINSQYPLIGPIKCDPAMQNCHLEVSNDLQHWYPLMDEEIIMLPSGDWAIDARIKHYAIGGPIEKDKAFYRVVGKM